MRCRTSANQRTARCSERRSSATASLRRRSTSRAERADWIFDMACPFAKGRGKSGDVKSICHTLLNTSTTKVQITIVFHKPSTTARTSDRIPSPNDANSSPGASTAPETQRRRSKKYTCTTPFPAGARLHEARPQDGTRPAMADAGEQRTSGRATQNVCVSGPIKTDEEGGAPMS